MQKSTCKSARRHCHFLVVSHGAVGTASAILLALILVPLTSMAGAEEPAASQAIEQVVVTARRRAESAQSVPLVVTAIDGDDLQAAGIEKLGDLTKIVPALSINDGTDRRNVPNYAIRAIRPTESLYGQDSSVAPYFADVVLAPAEGSNLSLYDLQSVQVLKGPQGTLFGRNTNGGAILFTPKRPGAQFGGDASLGYGNFDTIESEFGVDLPVADRFRTRWSGKYFKRDGYQTNVVNGQQMAGEETKSARFSAVWNITENIENYAVLTWDQARNQARAAVIKAVNPAAVGLSASGLLAPITASLARQQARSDIDRIEANNSLGAFENVDVWGGFNTTTVKLGDRLTLKNILGYRYVKYDSAFDPDGSSALQVLETHQPSNLHHLSEELQLLGAALDDNLSWQAGLYYFHEQGSQKSDGRVLGNVQRSGGTIDDDSYSVYAQGTYNFTPVWSLTVGGRYTRDEKSIVARNQTATQCSIFDSAGVRLPLSNCAREASATFSAPTGTLSFEYKPNDKALAYLATRRGYRSGGFNARATTNPAFEPFEPEYVTDLELGTKLDWDVGNWRYRTNVALFYEWYSDIQRSVSDTVILPGGTTPTVATAIQNAAKATVDGAELEATIMPTDALSLKLTYAYLNPKYEEWSDSVLVAGQPQRRDLTATPFQFIPKHQGSATLRYEIPLGVTAGTLELQSTYSTQSEVFVNAFGTIADMQGVPPDVLAMYTQTTYEQVDLSATLSDVLGSGFELSVYCKNATDDRHVVATVTQYKAIGFNDLIYSDPRTYGAHVRYRF